MNAPEALELKSGLQTRCEWQWRFPPSRAASSTGFEVMAPKVAQSVSSILSSCVRRASAKLKGRELAGRFSWWY
jgi:hypothetical protein